MVKREEIQNEVFDLLGPLFENDESSLCFSFPLTQSTATSEQDDEMIDNEQIVKLLRCFVF